MMMNDPRWMDPGYAATGLARRLKRDPGLTFEEAPLQDLVRVD
jgi:hypothetical protein